MTIRITDDRIEYLASEAAAHGDILMAAIAHRALGYGFEGFALTDAERAEVDSMSRAEAMAEIREVIAAAQAVAD